MFYLRLSTEPFKRIDFYIGYSKINKIGKMKPKPKSYAVYAIIAIIVILMLVIGRQRLNKTDTENKSIENKASDAGSGFLEVESTPKDADIFVDGVNKGKSPIVIGSVAAGMHNIAIKKEGYEDFLKQVEINPGKREFIDAKLIAVAQKELQTPAEEPKKEENITAKGPVWEESSNSGKMSLGNMVLMYYDFSGKKFWNTRPVNYDVFSKRYADHITFTRLNPAKIETIHKDIQSVVKEDCGGASGELKELFSGQTLCVVTQEGIVAAIGGSWEKNTENAELKWKVFS